MDIFVIIFVILTLVCLTVGLYIFTYERKRKKAWLALLLAAGLLFCATIMRFTYTFSISV
jgi:hypothetical protein